MKKRIISLLMCLVMAFSIVPAALEAAGDGSTVTLLQDVTLPDNDKVYISKEYGQQVSFAIDYTTPGSPDSSPAVKDTTSPATGDAGLVYAAIARARITQKMTGLWPVIFYCQPPEKAV